MEIARSIKEEKHMFRGEAVKQIVVLGAGGLASEILNLLEENNMVSEEWKILGCLDAKHQPGEERDILGYPILGDDNWLDGHTEEIFAVCAVGNPHIRQTIVQHYQKKYPCVRFPTLIHHNAQVSSHSEVGTGAVICSGVNITVDVDIADFALIDLASSVSHGSKIGPFSTVHPGSTICGSVTIEPLVEIGAGSKIIQGIHIGGSSVIGAGSVVVRDIPEGVVAYGNPCKVMRKL